MVFVEESGESVASVDAEPCEGRRLLSSVGWCATFVRHQMCDSPRGQIAADPDILVPGGHA